MDVRQVFELFPPDRTLKAMQSFLDNMSLEITAKQADKLPAIKANLPRGTKVFVALISPDERLGQLHAVKKIREAGLEPVPHIPARFIKDDIDLEERIKAFSNEAGVTTMLVLGGGAAQPVGEFHSTIQLLETGVFLKYNVNEIGIAGHPEGNPDIIKMRGEAAQLAALLEKQSWLQKYAQQGFIATQFLFEAAPLAYWARDIRRSGIELPLHVGVPGPATLQTLVKYAAVCGVGNSARFIRKQALNITKLLTVSTPDQFVGQLAILFQEKPELGIKGPHFYPFGGFEKLFTWLRDKL